VARTRDELVEGLREVAEGGLPRGAKLDEAPEEPARLAFLYPGQGAQRVGMLRDARDRFPVLRDTLDALESDLADALQVPLTHLLYPELRAEPVDEDTATTELTDTAHTQPVMLAAGLALTALLEQVGVRPHVVLGHSLGEFAAAAVGGVLTGAEAARFVAARGRAMADLDGDHGTMAAVMADRETVESLLVDGAVIANVNHPRQLVVSGFREAVERVVELAEAADVRAVPLQVSHGFHGPALSGLDSAPLLAGITLRDPDITVASGIAEEPYRHAADARDVFLRHATSPVEFVRGLEQCREAGADLFLQVGAGGPLAAFARGALPRDHRGIVTLAGKRDDDGGASILEGLADLWVRGVDVDVRAITAPAVLPSLPPTVLPREIYWAVKSEVQLPIEAGDVKPRPRPDARTPVAAAPTPASEAPAEEDVEARVLQVIARVSAYPVKALKPDMTLVDDLGFDSLMVGDLATGLSDAFAAIDGIPQELLINRPTVADIIAFARTAGQGEAAAVHDDDAPLTAYAPAWRPEPLPDLPGRSLSEGHRVLLVDVSAQVARAFSEASVTRVTAAEASQAGPADLIVWGDLAERPSPAAVLADEADAPDPAAPLIAALARQVAQGATPDVVALTRADDPWAGAVHGVVRGLPREWPGASATSLHLAEDALEQAGELARAQWESADRTADVRHQGGERAILHLGPRDAQDVFVPGPDVAVLITGGTRGIGLGAARRLLATGARVVLVGRSAPGPACRALLEEHPGRALAVQADVTDGDALAAAVATHAPLTAVVHAAGVLADGPLHEVDPARGAQARRVKAVGLLNAVRACGDALKAVVAVGSWAGRFGNRHQAHYNAANALLARLTEALPLRGVTVEFGPWSDSEMVRTIPAPVQAAMRAEGVDFVGELAGQDLLDQALRGHRGAVVAGRGLPATTRAAEVHLTLSTETHPYLLDHAIEGVPVLPLAGATDLMAWVAGARAPFVVEAVRLFQGVTVTEPVDLRIVARGDRVSLRQGPRDALAYTARVHAGAVAVEDPGPAAGGQAPELSLASFYRDITFHGPLLQGLTAIEGVGDDFVRGRLRVGDIRTWVPGTSRSGFVVDPYALDSAMQLSAYVAWIRYQRAGTPVGLGRLLQLAPLPAEGELVVDVAFGEMEGDRFSGTLRLRDPDSGRLVMVAEDVVAELRRADTAQDAPNVGADATGPDAPPEADFTITPEMVDFSAWKEVKELENRLMMAELAGIRNPYFRVQEGTARDTTRIEGREYINFSSYNYIGLSGDPRVLSRVHEAVDAFGTSVSASRVASGERPFHRDLEQLLAKAQRSEDALVFTAGHATNVTTIGHLFGPDDLILHDEYIHDSGLQGIKLSGARRRMFKHDDPDAAEAELRKLRRHFKRCLLLVEGVYSMDGDICALPRYIELKKKYGCLLMVDEAHSFGIVGQTGCGVGEHFDVAPGDVDIWMGTLSKSLASCGGWIAASKPLINYLRYTAPGFVYSAGLTAANGIAALASLELMLAEPWRVQKLQHNATFFQRALAERGVDTGPARGESGVIPAITGNSMWALQLAQRLVDQGINVQPIVYPAVPDDAARLRYFLSSTHSEAQLRHTADLTADTLEQVKQEFPVPA